MNKQATVLLFVSDQPVLSSLQFSLAIEGFETRDGAAEDFDLSAAMTLVIDQEYRGDGLAMLGALRATGCATPAIILATNPTPRLLGRAAAAGAALIEKPLLGDELSAAIGVALETRKAA